MGDQSRAFVSKALEVATQNPDFLPRSLRASHTLREQSLDIGAKSSAFGLPGSEA